MRSSSVLVPPVPVPGVTMCKVVEVCPDDEDNDANIVSIVVVEETVVAASEGENMVELAVELVELMLGALCSIGCASEAMVAVASRASLADCCACLLIFSSERSRCMVVLG